jgi:hypothetical protein
VCDGGHPQPIGQRLDVGLMVWTSQHRLPEGAPPGPTPTRTPAGPPARGADATTQQRRQQPQARGVTYRHPRAHPVGQACPPARTHVTAAPRWRGVEVEGPYRQVDLCPECAPVQGVSDGTTGAWSARIPKRGAESCRLCLIATSTPIRRTPLTCPGSVSGIRRDLTQGASVGTGGWDRDCTLAPYLSAGLSSS